MTTYIWSQLSIRWRRYFDISS